MLLSYDYYSSFVRRVIIRNGDRKPFGVLYFTRQRIFISLFLTSLALNAAAITAHFPLACIPVLITGWYLADLASRLTHMLLDYRPMPVGKRLEKLYFYAGSRESDKYLALVRRRMAGISAFDRLIYDFKDRYPPPRLSTPVGFQACGAE